VRLFFALGLNPVDATKIGDWRDRQFPGMARAVPLGNLHITLAFLGELDGQRLETLCENVDELALGGPLELTLDTIGYWHKPGICWLGPTQWPDRLNRIASRLDELGVAQGGKRARSRYQPHLTLLRGCQSPPPAPLESPRFKMRFADFSLFESRQRKHRVHYESLADWRL